MTVRNHLRVACAALTATQGGFCDQHCLPFCAGGATLIFDTILMSINGDDGKDKK